MRTLLLVVLAGSGCATTTSATVAWPAAPATERIRLVRTLGGQADLDGPLARFWRGLAGSEAPARCGRWPGRPWEAPPVGVALEGETTWVVVPNRKALLAFSRDGSPARSLELEDCERPTGLAVDAAARRADVTDTSSSSGAGHAVHVHDLDSGEHLATLGRRAPSPPGCPRYRPPRCEPFEVLPGVRSRRVAWALTKGLVEGLATGGFFGGGAGFVFVGLGLVGMAAA